MVPAESPPGAWQRGVADFRLAGNPVLPEPAQTAGLMAPLGLGGFPGSRLSTGTAGTLRAS